MKQRFVLSRFPARTHRLILVSDPDNLLADEHILATLLERGFTVIDELDSVVLRHRVEQARPWSISDPLIVVTAGSLNQLPYDLWQQGHHVTLELHTAFPKLSYPVVRTLTPVQLSRLEQAPVPSGRLGRKGTVQFLLRYVFNAELEALQQPGNLVAWLALYHGHPEPIPSLILEHLEVQLRQAPVYADWPLKMLLADGDGFSRWMHEQWVTYVQKETGELMREANVDYLLDFEHDQNLQQALPRLVQSGTLTPVELEHRDRVPRWASPGVLAPDQDRRPRRAEELLGILADCFPLPPASGLTIDTVRWAQWQNIARAWAELTTLRYDPDDPLGPDQKKKYGRLQVEIDKAFLAWLHERYAPLGARRLPEPHHVYHVPHYIDYHRRQTETHRVAMLVLDGLSLADWLVIRPAWQARHPGWRLDERLLLAQIPTLTAVSRQALVSGLRPADFTETLNTTRVGHRRWKAFWARQGLPPDACPHLHLALERDGLPAEVHSAHSHALCLIENTIDDMVHDATLGTMSFQALLKVWLEHHSTRLEVLIVKLLVHGFTVYLTSDHGHVQARGFGRPSEGLTVETRGTRARIYSDRHAVDNVHQEFQDTICWHQDGLLPDSIWVLMPQGRKAFMTANDTVVTHGGPTVDEVVVPLVTLTLRD